ncbi:MAG: tetratricopeptide repeat protein [Bacteroidota bacterium]
MSKYNLKAGIVFLMLISFTLRLYGDQRPATVKNAKTDSTAYTRIKKLLDIALQHHDAHSIAICYQQIGDIFLKEGVLPQALEYYYKAQALLQEHKDPSLFTDNLNKIGRVYFKNSRNKMAMANFRQAAALSSKERYSLGTAEANKYIALIFEKTGQHDSAYRYQELALRSYQQLHNKEQVAFTYAKIGGIYEDEGRYDEALSYFFKALGLYKAAANNGQAGLLNNIGDTYRKMHNYKDALAYSKQAERLAILLGDQQQISSAHRDLAKIYEMTGRFDSAYYYSEKARVAYAKSFNNDNDKKINLLQTLFNVQQKNNEIARLESEKRLDHILSISLASIVLLAAFLGFSVISRQRLKNKNEKMIYKGRNETMKLELANRQLQEESLKNKLELQSKELTSHTLLIIQKNQFIDGLKQKVAKLIKDDKRDQRKELKQLIGLIDENSDQDKNWEDFRSIYENVHENFFDGLKQHAESLTATDLRFLALLKMNMDPADIATMLGISQSSLRTARYRVKKKLQLSESESLSAFIHKI